MRRSSHFVFLIVATASVAIALLSSAQQVNSGRPAVANKLAPSLRQRVDHARPDSIERVRVVVRAADGTQPDQLRTRLQEFGAKIDGQLDALGLTVGDMPLAKLDAAASHDEIAWISPDQEVKSLGTSTNNTSHVEVTSGASKFLPADNKQMAYGGAGNNVGIAILDSGISPADAAEFVGYEWRTSTGLLGTGIFGEPYLASYDRIRKRVDFTGETKGDDAYGHGTHTAGIAAGTGQSSEDYAASNPGAPSHAGVATV